jgi:hypothetical protein
MTVQARRVPSLRNQGKRKVHFVGRFSPKGKILKLSKKIASNVRNLKQEGRKSLQSIKWTNV